MAYTYLSGYVKYNLIFTYAFHVEEFDERAKNVTEQSEAHLAAWWVYSRGRCKAHGLICTAKLNLDSRRGL